MRDRAWRMVLAVLALAAIGYALHFAGLGKLIVQGAIALQGLGAPGVACTFLAILALTALLFPIIPLVVACGWLYGLAGALVSLPAATLSAVLAFSLARKLGKLPLADHPRARALLEYAAERGVFTVVLVRVSPILPFTPSNALLGLSPMRLRDLALGTFIGMAPGVLLYTWAGSLLPDAEALERGAHLQPGPLWALFAVSLSAASLLGAAAARKLRALSRRA